jgi:adenylate cyclase
MALSEDVSGAVDTIFGTKFEERDGQKVPTSEDVALKNGAVKLTAAFLYADLAGSSVIAKQCPWDTTAKIIRAYLDSSVRIIRSFGGEIRSFDGDRVMGVFIGGSKCTSATKAALKIKYATQNIIQAKATGTFASVRNNNVIIRQCCGIDMGISRAVRAGVRNNNDLIWIGRPPSLAAKLSDLRDHPYSTWISKAVYGNLADEAKFSSGTNMWEERLLTYAGGKESVYRSSYHWSL